MTNRPSVTVQVVTWNSLTHLPTCLDAVVKQTYQPLQLMIIDNASVDGTVTWLEEHYPHVHVLRNTRNNGFCRAHNQGLRIGRSEFILLLNPDLILSPNWLERGIQYLTSHPEAGAFGGKLKRYSYSTDELKEIRNSDIIDSAGIQVFRSRHAVDRGSGQPDDGRFNQAEEVFAVSGACLLVRKSALETIRYRDEYLDEDFFAYKDDLDLCWRLRRRGWTIWFDPKALAWHHREIKGTADTRSWALVKNFRRRQRQIAKSSYRNHWLLLAKHETAATWWRDWPWIGWYEFRKFGFLMVTNPAALRSLGQVVRLWPKMRRKAAVMNRQAKQSALVTRGWFLHT